MRTKNAPNTENWTAERLRALRARYGESRRVFCSRLRVTQWAVQRWEDGVTAVPASMGIVLSMLEMLAPKEDVK